MARFWQILGVAMLALFAAAGASRAQSTLDPDQATLRLSALIAGTSAPLTGGLKWRVYLARPAADGARPLVAVSSLAQPILTVPAGDYVVHVAFGLASAAKRVTLGQEVRAEQVPLTAGALRIVGTLAEQPIDASKLALAIYVPERRNPEGKLVYAKARAGEVIGLPEGAYHIVSTYLDTVGAGALAAPAPAGGKSAAPATGATPTNSIVAADIKVATGKLTEVTLRHRCAMLTLKLVTASGQGALANTSFTVLTPGGDLIRELIGAFPSLVLAEGEYVVIARHDAKTYQATFQVHSGLDHDVEVIAQDAAKQGN